MSSCLGLDIGGANIKLAIADDLGSIVKAESIPFPLWKHKEQLADQLQSLVDQTETEVDVAVTMTGELADCFESRKSGVKFIAEAMVSCCQQRKLVFYGTDGNWYQADTADRNWESIAAANWYAIASFASRFLPSQSGFLVDVGSTTTDIIPIRNGTPRSKGKTDFERLRANELLYAGVSRTPVSSIMPTFLIENHEVGAAREFFATMNDVFLLTGEVKESPMPLETADGRPATKHFASIRLARMVCEDADQFGDSNIREIAAQTKTKLIELLGHSLRTVLANNSDLPRIFVLSGQGDWLGNQAVQHALGAGHLPAELVYLKSEVGDRQSCCAAAVAVATLSIESVRDDKPISIGSRSVKSSQALPFRIVKLGGSLLDWRETPKKNRQMDCSANACQERLGSWRRQFC